MQLEAERLREPVSVAGERAEQHAADDDVVEVRDEEQAVVQHEVGGRHREQHAGHAADHERDDEAERPQHRRRTKTTRPPNIVNSQLKTFTPVGTAMIIVEMPKIALTSGPGPHREEVMQPDHERQQADDHRGQHHRAVAEQRLPRERREHFGEDAERGQDQDVDLWMAPGPDEVHEHHHVAAGLVREEVEAEVAVEQSASRASRSGSGRRRRSTGSTRASSSRTSASADSSCPAPGS